MQRGRPATEPQTGFAKLLESYRHQTGLTIGEFCKHLGDNGVSRETYRRWLNGLLPKEQGYYIFTGKQFATKFANSAKKDLTT